MPEACDLSIIIPARDEAATLGALLTQLQAVQPGAEILVVDDGSTDGTGQTAANAGARVLRHPYSKGNGACIKTGLRAARGTAVLIMDADGQHDPRDVPRLVAGLGEYDLVVGARDEQSQTASSVRLYHTFLNAFAGYIAERPVPDATSGLRAARRELLLQFIHLLPNGFSTPVTSTLAFVRAGYSVAFVPLTMHKRAAGQSKIQPLRDGMRFVLIVFRMVTLFAPMKVFLPISLLFMGLGLVYAALDMLLVAQRLHVANTAVLLLTMGVLVFLIGLVSEQIASLRLERTTKEESQRAR